jgi:TetR/AcrR family transcriptional regulator, transcriptional repressor of aconitase
MPKVTEEHKERRRAQILDGARRCFARHGYEGATVARLEAETGLSRGAIFNYFENKQALFVAAASETSDRLTRILLEQGFRAAVEAIAEEDADWIAIQLESVRRFRTDPEFRKQVAAKESSDEERQARLDALRRHGLRTDVPIEQVAVFLSCVANGVGLRRASDDPLPDLDVLTELVEHGVSPPAGASTT